MTLRLANIFKPGSDTAIVTEYEEKFCIGKWRYYKVKFLRKRATLILSYEIMPNLGKLKRITNYFFVGTHPPKEGSS